MNRNSLFTVDPVSNAADQRKFVWITSFIIMQCLVILIASITVFQCIWNPDRVPLNYFDYYKLSSIMYLYDRKVCGYTREAKSRYVLDLELSNDTRGLNVQPIRRIPAMVTVSTRLSAKTRKHIKISLVFHTVWMILAVALRLVSKNNDHPRFLKITMSCFFYACIIMILFDLSMAIVYVAHIKQSLTKNMIIRYSGWSVLLELKNEDDFAGWLPLIACGCWLRGIIGLGLNYYCIRIIHHVRKKIYKREVRAMYALQGYLPVPEAKGEGSAQHSVLYYRPGEMQPYVARSEQREINTSDISPAI